MLAAGSATDEDADEASADAPSTGTPAAQGSAPASLPRAGEAGVARDGYRSVRRPGSVRHPGEPGDGRGDAGGDDEPSEELGGEIGNALADRRDALAPLARAAREHDVDPDLVAALAWHESRWDQDARSQAGAVGIMQVMPATAEGVGERLEQSLDPTDIEDNAMAGTAYLARLKADFDSPRQALIAYNMGPTRLREQGPLTVSEEFADRVLETRDELAGADVDWPTTERDR